MTYEEILCDANNLYKAYLASIGESKWKESTQRFMANYLTYIFEIQESLRERTLQNGKTSEFVLHERGRVRPITSISIPDRIVRHTLIDELLLDKVKRKIIYDNCASIKDRGISLARKRIEVHLHKFYIETGSNDGWILVGDFTKFYDNIIHDIAKQQLVGLCDNDDFIVWLLDVIFSGFVVDVSYMTDEEYACCMEGTFNKLEHRKIPKDKLTGDKFLHKSVNIGDQASQIIGVYYPHRIDNYVKYVRSQKYYARYNDDFYIIGKSKDELIDIYENIKNIAKEYGIHLNEKKTRILRLSDSFKYLQIKYTLTKDGKILKKINPKRVTTIRRKLKKLAVKIQNGEIPYENAETMFKGWMGGNYKLLSREQRKGLISLFENLFSKTISIEHRKMIIKDREEKSDGIMV